MVMSLASILQARRAAILRDWARDPLIQVQAESPVVLGRLSYLNQGSSGTIAKIGRFSDRNVVIVSPPGQPNPHRTSVWVRSQGYQGYLAAFGAFLRQVYGLDLADAKLPGYDIDHLLNRARSPTSETFVRIEPVLPSVNNLWGSGFEKTASGDGFSGSNQRERRTMSWAIAAKLAGQAPPKGIDDVSGIERIANALSAYGLSRQEAVQGITSMMADLERRRR